MPNFVPVVSAALSAVSYDRTTQKMLIRFNEKVYEYLDVPQEVLLDVMFADSIGQEFDKLIKKGGFSFRQVAADAV